jgi:hypothetical protein
VLTIPAATPLAFPRDTREDPFNLIGFFPSCPAESQEDWDWIRSSETRAEELEDENEDDVASMYSHFSMSEQTKSKEEESSYDEFARQVIDGEDKFGMLAFCECPVASSPGLPDVSEPPISL